MAVKSRKLSAQSPAWSRNARPSQTVANAAVSERASPAKTSGGIAFSSVRAASAAVSSGHAGWCPAVRARHEEGDQVGSETVIAAV